MTQKRSVEWLNGTVIRHGLPIIVGVVIGWNFLTNFFIPRAEHAMLSKSEQQMFISNAVAHSLFVTRAEYRLSSNEILLAVYQVEVSQFRARIKGGEVLDVVDAARYKDLQDSLAKARTERQRMIFEDPH